MMEASETHSLVAMGKVKVDAYQCERCGHVWLPREATKREHRDPVICPKCKSAYWDIPRKDKEGRKK